jgi:hypothetical protein
MSTGEVQTYWTAVGEHARPYTEAMSTGSLIVECAIRDVVSEALNPMFDGTLTVEEKVGKVSQWYSYYYGVPDAHDVIVTVATAATNDPQVVELYRQQNS